MKKMTHKCLLTLALMAGLIVGTAAHAAEYEITVTNLTRSQPLTQIVAVTHIAGIRAFQIGTPVIKEVADIAQDGDTAAFNALVKSVPSNIIESSFDSGAPTPPGKTTKFTITADGDRTSLTLLSMLANTNDAIIGLNAIPLPTDTKPEVHMVPAMDAGVEDNDEDCKYIPGPACNNPKKASAKPGEGFLHISNGIHGQGSLSAPIYDWQNPTARISITKVK